MANEIEKEVVKEAIKEWLNEKVAQFVLFSMCLWRVLVMPT
jgi:hypothetical protein